MKAFYDNKPEILSEVGNGAVLYRYNIASEEVNAQASSEKGENEEKRTQWSCEEVTIWKPLTSNKITEAVITTRWDGNYEQKLINEYNAAQLGLYGAKTSAEAKARIQAYTDYLSERSALKAQVDADCKELGIE